jgi:hypothetical protein
LSVTPDDIRTFAEQERQDLLRQARAAHAERVKAELKHFARELEHIDRTYRLRLTRVIEQDENNQS